MRKRVFGSSVFLRMLRVRVCVCAGVEPSPWPARSRGWGCLGDARSAAGVCYGGMGDGLRCMLKWERGRGRRGEQRDRMR